MKRTPLTRRTPLRRTWWQRAADTVRTLVRRTPVKAKRSRPRRKAHPENRALRNWVRTQPCCLADYIVPARCAGPIDPHHVRTRGAGGGELANLVPLCRRHHDELHQTGRRSFAEAYGVNLLELAQAYTLRWQIEAEPFTTGGAA